MIKYQIKKNINDQIVELTIKGHALFGDFGNDIVCSGVSTATIITANAIKHLGYSKLVDVKYDEGYFNFKLKEIKEVPLKLIENLVLGLDDLASQYPSNITKENL